MFLKPLLGIICLVSSMSAYSIVEQFRLHMTATVGLRHRIFRDPKSAVIKFCQQNHESESSRNSSRDNTSRLNCVTRLSWRKRSAANPSAKTTFQNVCNSAETTMHWPRRYYKIEDKCEVKIGSGVFHIGSTESQILR